MYSCVEYCQFNTTTFQNSFAISHMDEWTDSRSKKQMFSSTMDANWGYLLIKKGVKDAVKTVFVTHHEFSKHLRMSFWLRNASASFQESTNAILPLTNWQQASVCTNFMLTFSRKLELQLKDIEKVLLLLQDSVKAITLKHCFLFRKILTIKGDLTALDKTKSGADDFGRSQAFTIPVYLSRLLSLLSLWNVHLRFIPNFAKVASLLWSWKKGSAYNSNLMKKNAK